MSLAVAVELDQASQSDSDVDGVPDEILPPVLQQELEMEVRVPRRERRRGAG